MFEDLFCCFLISRNRFFDLLKLFSLHVLFQSFFSWMCVAVWRALSCVALPFSIPFIYVREDSCRLEYHISKNSWLWLPIVGSNSSFEPLSICFDSMHCDKNFLWDWYRAFLSLKRLSLIACYSLYRSANVDVVRKFWSSFKLSGISVAVDASLTKIESGLKVVCCHN